MSIAYPETMLLVDATATRAGVTTLVGITAAGVWMMRVSARGCVGRLGRTPEQISRMCELHPELAPAITEAGHAWRQMRSRNDVTVH